MGFDKKKRTRQRPDSDISDFDDSTQPPTTSNDTPTQHFPRFILVESKDEERNYIFVPVFDTKSNSEHSW